MDLLKEPFEILELADGTSLTLKIVSREEGETVIHPRYPGAPAEKRIPVMRLHVDPEYKPVGPPYWDVTSKTLQAQFRPLLPGIIERGAEVVITAHGSGPAKRFSLVVR